MTDYSNDVVQEIHNKPRERGGSPYRDRRGSAKETVHSVFVDYRKRSSLPALREKYDCGVSNLFDGRPWTRHPSVSRLDSTPRERTFCLREIPEEFLGKKLDGVWSKLADHFYHGPHNSPEDMYRFAIEVELDAFGAANPDLQRENCILALGSYTYDNDFRKCIAYLGGDDHGRWLHGGSADHFLDKNVRVLTVFMGRDLSDWFCI